MGSVNGVGVFEYNRSDGGIGPALLNLQSAALTAAFKSNTPIKPVANTTGRSAYATSFAAARGAITPSNPCIVWRADAPEGGQLEFTTNGSTWSSTKPGRQSYVLSMLSGWEHSGSIIKVGSVVRFSGSIKRTSSSITLTDAWTQIATIPSGCHTTDVFSGICFYFSGSTATPLETEMLTNGELRIRSITGNHTFASGTPWARLNNIGPWTTTQ